MTLTVRNPVDGSAILIEEPLLGKHVQVGRLLWYSGITSMSGWDCPAIITEVDTENQKFRIRSLDDMREQEQWYEFDINEHSCTSRQMMRLTSPELVTEYLIPQRVRLKQAVLCKQASFEEAEKLLAHFDEIHATLNL
ncbi:MAG: hypothetical protein AAB472_01675 [Patescibacteria group bacterium]|mgnify:CR=1 FL=1